MSKPKEGLKPKYKKGDVVQFIEDYGPIKKGHIFTVEEVEPYYHRSSINPKTEFMLRSKSEHISVWEFRVRLMPQYKTKIAELM